MSVSISSSGESLSQLQVESISPFGTKTSRPLGEVMGHGHGDSKQKFCLWTPWGNSEWCHPRFHPWVPGPVSPGSQRNSASRTLTRSIDDLPKNLAWSARCCLLAGAVTESSPGTPAILLSQLLQNGGECGETSKSMSTGPSLHPVCHTASSLTENASVRRL